MNSLAAATELVPFEDPEEKEEPDSTADDARMTKMSLENLIDILVVPTEDNRDTVEWTFEALGQHYGSAANEDQEFMKFIQEATAEQLHDEFDAIDRQAEQDNEGEKILKHMAGSIFKRIIKWGLKKVLKLVLRAVKWVIKEVVGRAIRMVIDWLVRPILTGVLEFIGVNPELWPVIAILGGVAALAYIVWDKLFKDKDMSFPSTAPTVADEGTQIVEAPRSAPRAAAPQPAGGVSAGGSPGSLGDLISRGEGNYSSVNLGAAHGYKAAQLPLETMTVADVMAAQQRGDFNAAGRYQIIKGTLADAVKSLRLSGSEKFDRATQDRIFNEYLIGTKRRAIADYISGRSNDLNAAILAASQEWASVAAPAGARLQSGAIGDGTTSYYAGTANNKASISAAEMAKTLEKARSGQPSNTTVNEVPAQMKNGVSVVPPAVGISNPGAGTTTTNSRVGPPPTAPKNVIKGKNGELIAVNT